MGKEKEFHTFTTEEILTHFESGKNGITQQEARKRQSRYGLNKISEQKEKSIIQLFISQLNNPVIYLLAAAVIISFIFNDIPEAIAILVVIVLNTIIGFWMEFQARSSMKALKKMDKFKTRVIRDNKNISIDAQHIVPGDIIDLEAGDIVPADARIISYSELSVDESPLTGESVPVEKTTDTLDKNTPLPERRNMLYKGTAVTNGKVNALVTGTGMNTEIGNISKMVSEAGEEKIPLNKKLGKLSHRLIWVTLGLALLFLLFGWIAGKDIYILLQTAIAWTVAAIPEGLPIVASIALARGMLRLAKQNVIVKQLAAVETLGETTVIFTDKTGTLTENKLSVSQIILPAETMEIGWDSNNQPEIKNADPFKSRNFNKIYEISVLCNDAEVTEHTVKGDPLEIALKRFTSRMNRSYYEKTIDWERINEDPFDSESKMMGTVNKNDDGIIIYAKGAVEPILNHCNSYLDEDNVKKTDQQFRKEWISKNNELSANGLRVIAYAYKETSKEKEKELSKEEEFISDMIFVGLVGFIDPPRADIAEAMETCHNAGINVVMVTGDHPETAKNIAKQVKLLDKDEDKSIHGTELKKKISGNTKEREQITSTKVFARVDPGQKLDIVEYFRDSGEIVGMTGDGVNDAPALKKADIGIAMGKRGTQVAKEVADMVLKDDSFPSIVKAIEQGRIIFGNIRKFIIYQLSYHLAEIIIIAGISFTMFQLPLLPLQLLFLNLLSDVFPALALGVGKGNANIMSLPPKNPEEPIITKKNWITTGIYGLVITIFVVAAYLYCNLKLGLSQGICNNVAFFSLAFAQLLHVFDMREADEHIFINQVTKNKYIWLALLFCLIVLISSYMIPVLHQVLSFEKLDLTLWLIISIASISTLVFNQLLKHFLKL